MPDKANERAEDPRFLVVQYGARHNYAIPAAFERAGALAGVYTDLTSIEGVGANIARFWRGRGRLADALSRRTPPPNISTKFCSSGAIYMAGEFLRSSLPGSPAKELATRISKYLAERRMVSRGTAGATHVYTMLGEGGQFVRRAKEEGLGVVGDVYIALSADRIVAEEARNFPDWTNDRLRELHVEDEKERNSVLLTLSDLLVCPSDFVCDDLVAHYGVDARRTIVLPYAVSPRWQSLVTAPEPGRVLFAGSATIRKGIHYLADAAAKLKGTCQFRVAGAVSSVISEHPGAANLKFLGHLGMAKLAHEFAKADVFVLPSLAEGSASVTAEALGAGVPVVTTKAAGSIVRDGLDGIIVPERDFEALAEAIRSIVQDRERRASMSQSARVRANAFTWDSFAHKIIEATGHIASLRQR